MLSYPTWRINQLLAQNTPFRTMRDFGVRASNLFFYYRDLDRATAFYRDTLGLELVADYTMARIFRVAEESYLILVDAAKGMHTADEPKSVALALLTDQLEQWHDYLATKGLRPGRPFAARPGSAHDGFVIKDPEGYLLEFERFNQHPENERFVPLLKANRTVRAPQSPLPEGLGFKATITWLYYKDLLPMQTFYEEVLGVRQVVDQGWAKVYEGSKTGHVGLVDERRGMNKWTETKAVNVSFLVDDIDGWFAAVKGRARAYVTAEVRSLFKGASQAPVDQLLLSGIAAGLVQDLRVDVREANTADAILTVRFVPAASWIWIAGVFAVLGALVAALAPARREPDAEGA